MLQGGTKSQATLTAYVLTAIYEVKLSSLTSSTRYVSALLKAQRYLERLGSSLYDPYSLALTSYALFKSGSNNVDGTSARLDAMVKRDGMYNCLYQ